MMNQGEKRFNKDVFLPPLKLPTEPKWLEYTEHALDAAEEDRYGNLLGLLPDYLEPGKYEVVECRMVGKKVTQLLVRVPVTEKLDLVMAVGTGFLVYTVWGNLRSDTHKTLRRELYETKVA